MNIDQRLEYEMADPRNYLQKRLKLFNLPHEQQAQFVERELI
jgi:hypothetical protein